MQEQFANDVETTLSAPITNSEVVAPVVSAAGFPTVGQFRIRVENEIMVVVLIVGPPPGFYVARGAEGTAAVAHPAGAAVVHVLTAGALGGGSDATGSTPSLRSLGTTAITAVAGNDSRIPTQNENDALAATPAPTAANKFVTETDPRLGGSSGGALTFNTITTDYTLSLAQDVLPGNLGRVQRGNIAAGLARKLIAPLASAVLIPDGVRFPIWSSGLGTFRVAPDPYDDEVLALSPAVYLSLGVGGLTDLSPGPLDGTGVGGITIGGAAALMPSDDTRAATDLDGVDDYITTAYGPFSNTAGLTVVGIVSRDTSGSFDTLFGSSGGTNTVKCRLDTGAPTDVVFDPDVAAGGANTFGGAWSVANGQAAWYALRFNPTASAINGFGAASVSFSINGAAPIVQASALSYGATPGNFKIGASGAGAGEPFDGKQQEIAVFPTCLTDVQLAALYAAYKIRIRSTGVPPGDRVLAERESGGELIHVTGDEWWLTGDLV